MVPVLESDIRGIKFQIIDIKTYFIWENVVELEGAPV